MADILWLAAFYSFMIHAASCPAMARTAIQNGLNFTEFMPACTVMVANETAECGLKLNHICCAEEETLTPYPYQKINDTAVTFTLPYKTDHKLYLSKECSTKHSYCISITISIPDHKLAELQAKDVKAIGKMTNLPSELKYGLFVATPHAFSTGLRVQNDQHLLKRGACDALTNTSMNMDVISELFLAAKPSLDLNGNLAADLVASPCNFNCTEGVPQNCEWHIVEVKKWPELNERLVFNASLISGLYYCVLVRHAKPLNCAIALETFKHQGSQELALSEGKIMNDDVDLIVSVCLLFLTLCTVCILFLIVCFIRGRGFLSMWHFRPRSPEPVTYPATFPGDSLNLVRCHDPMTTHLPPPARILFLYSRDSKELCACMKALGDVLKLSTHAEILDPLNDLWGGESEESRRLLSYREGNLSTWLYAHLVCNCSILLLMSPGGKIRHGALDRLEKMSFDPPHMLDDVFLLGLDFIRIHRARDYSNVFQISLESIGDTGETYNVGVPLAKYILPLRLQQLIATLQRDNLSAREFDNETASSQNYGKFDKAVVRFERALSGLKKVHMKDPQYMDRAII